MAEENKSHEYGQSGSEEVKDRGLFDFLKKDDDQPKPADHDHHACKPEDEVIVTEFDQKVTVSEYEEPAKYEECKEEEEEEKKPSLLEKLHRSNSSSSSSSDEEEEDENGEKKKKKKEKKGLKEKIFGDKEEKKEEKYEEKKEEKYEDTSVPIEKYDDAAPEEKKGFLEKIKEKLPGQGKKSCAEETVVVAPASSTEYSHEQAHGSYDEPEKEKKGFLEKIKEKLPGYHAKTDEESEKEKEKEKY